MMWLLICSVVGAVNAQYFLSHCHPVSLHPGPTSEGLRCWACSVTQFCLTLWGPMDCSQPGSSAHGIFQARILEWGAISYTRGSFWSRDWTHVSWVSCGFFTTSTTWEAFPKTASAFICLKTVSGFWSHTVIYTVRRRNARERTPSMSAVNQWLVGGGDKYPSSLAHQLGNTEICILCCSPEAPTVFQFPTMVTCLTTCHVLSTYLPCFTFHSLPGFPGVCVCACVYVRVCVCA